ncbi:endonuclease/exonuclease/phosphatase family protein [Psychrobacter sp. UBA3962]|uniref:endonuclease/exonuclease/phosphatase family protein n=1 Tax=Psychrobacter sp. UBA3962 TaxID=1947352 RepID=UPI0025EA5151|nr:endonuclease/exonuclease/phosphatase family protein [Psychrobacter sp. UBA3962]
MLDSLYFIFQILAGLVVFVSVWGLLPLDHWWIRGVDFPRIQILVIGLVSLIGLLVSAPQWESWDVILLVALIAAVGLQLRMILPYTRLWKKEVRQALPIDDAVQLKLMVSNVLTPNNNTQALVDLVQQKQPDVLITLESDQKWQDALTVIEPDYPYTVKVPLDNLYGMHLYSKFELIDPEVKYLLIDDIPSIHTQLRLPNGEVIWLYCLHPMPPSPTEADKSTTRDAELLMVGRHIKENNQTAILAGDLNDVAWSKTTLMFQRISGLLDPRIGRFFINTFHVDYPFLRWALDHIFHSPCFTLVDIERLPSIGSDHFPVLTTLQYEACATAEQQQNATEATAKDKQETAEKIEEGKEEGERLSQEHAEAEQEKAEQEKSGAQCQ